MIKFINEFAYWFEFIFGYMSTSPHNLPFYHRMMYEKYGTRYCSQEQFDEYWRSLDDEPTSGYVNQD